MVTIELSPYDRLTVRWFVMHYLFEKAAGARVKGEEYPSELYRQWTMICSKVGKKFGNDSSFRREIRRMKELGILEPGRTDPRGSEAMPRQYYLLTSEYFSEMLREQKESRRK